MCTQYDILRRESDWKVGCDVFMRLQGNGAGKEWFWSVMELLVWLVLR